MLSARMIGERNFKTELLQPCSAEALAPGMLMYVGSVALLNAQGGLAYEVPEQDSHIVMVESVEQDGVIVVINPDRRRCGVGFIADKWGRMKIAPGQLGDVWCTSRLDGTHTSCAAVRILERIPLYLAIRKKPPLYKTATKPEKKRKSVATGNDIAYSLPFIEKLGTEEEEE
jgi:hypothetical protein